jgi:hypothetical protein
MSDLVYPTNSTAMLEKSRWAFSASKLFYVMAPRMTFTLALMIDLLANATPAACGSFCGVPTRTYADPEPAGIGDMHTKDTRESRTS